MEYHDGEKVGGMMVDVTRDDDYDWADDDTMSREETLARFEALDPSPSVGPKAGREPIRVRPGAGALKVFGNSVGSPQVGAFIARKTELTVAS